MSAPASASTRENALKSNPAAAPSSSQASLVKPKAAAVRSGIAGKSKKAKKTRRAVRERLAARIDLSTQRMTVLVDGKVKYVWKVSTGKNGHHTPTGSYRPYYLASMHYSRKYDNAPMPHSVFFRGGFAIHATGAVRRLGTPASHGCVRLSPSHARTFFNLVKKYGKAATRIRIVGRTPNVRSRHYAKKRSHRRSSIARNQFSYGYYSTAGSYSSYYRSYYRSYQPYRAYRPRPARSRRIRVRRHRRNNVFSWSY